MQTALQNLVQSTRDSFLGLIDGSAKNAAEFDQTVEPMLANDEPIAMPAELVIDHSGNSPRVENSAKSLASAAMTAEFDEFDQMTANVFTPEERAALPTFEDLPAAGEVIFNNPNLVQDVNSGTPAQDVVRTALQQTAPIYDTPARTPQIAEYRDPRQVFQDSANLLGANIEKSRQAVLSGNAHHRQAQEHDLMVKEAKIGGTLFGPIPKGSIRTFFNLNRYTWVWNEVAYNPATKSYTETKVEYDLQPQGVLKVMNGEAKGYIEGKELTMILGKMRTYHNRVLSEVYGYN